MKKEVVGDHDQRSGSAVGIGDQGAEIAGPKHTPLPWRTDPEVDHQGVLGPDDILVADCSIFVNLQFGNRTDEINTANARLIVRAVNSHADMLGLARLFAKTVEYYIRADRLAGDDEGARLKTITLNMIRDTLAKAEGRS